MHATDIYQPRAIRRESRHSIRGFDYLVHEWGEEGRPLLFYLHGWGDTGSTFQFVVDELQQAWHIVAPDFRGFGGTTGNATSYWFPDYLADLDQLFDIYSPAPANLLGHSMGGNVAGLYAGIRPGRVSALVNIEGMGLRNTSAGSAPQRYRDWLDGLRVQPGFADYADFSALARKILSRNPAMGLDKAEYVARCWGVSRGDRIGIRSDPLHKLPNPVLYRRAESEACWSEIAARVLLVTGEHSDIPRKLGSWPGSATAALPEFQSVVVPGAGHMLHFDTPGALAAAIENFLAAE